MSMVNITIDGKPVQVPAGTTVLEAAKQAGIDIPTLCYLKDINEIGACRMCLVEIKGAKALQAACVYPVAEGNEILTASPAVKEARKVNLELLLSNHKRECLTCVRSKNCELQSLADELNITDLRFEGERCDLPMDLTSASLVRDPQKCIACRRCVAVCRNVQKIGVIDAVNRGFNTSIGPAFGMGIGEVACVNCGQCLVACPVGAITEKSAINQVWDAIADPEKVVLVQTAPAVRAAIGEEFGMPIGSVATKQMVGAMLGLGFDKVFDTDTAADLTILEEGTELLHRIQNGGTLPLITSCSPGWIKYCEHYFPDMTENLSSCKSPQQMFGAIAKSYYAEKMNLDPKDIVSVSIMPCTAKKFEIQRPDEAANGVPDVDYSLTTRELARMIRKVGLKFTTLPDEEFDAPLGLGTGAAVIFGATGGVMEAALRSAHFLLTGKNPKTDAFKKVRGVKGWKEAIFEIEGVAVKVAVVSGLGNTRELLTALKKGEVEYDFVEIMACPGGCAGGGGQPIHDGFELAEERGKTLYGIDSTAELRFSHENPTVQLAYKEFLGEPLSKRAHELLHTHITDWTL